MFEIFPIITNIFDGAFERLVWFYGVNGLFIALGTFRNVGQTT